MTSSFSDSFPLKGRRKKDFRILFFFPCAAGSSSMVQRHLFLSPSYSLFPLYVIIIFFFFLFALPSSTSVILAAHLFSLASPETPDRNQLLAGPGHLLFCPPVFLSYPRRTLCVVVALPPSLHSPCARRGNVPPFSCLLRRPGRLPYLAVDTHVCGKGKAFVVGLLAASD